MDVHPETQLSGTAAGGEIWVVFQNHKLEVVALVRREGRWIVAGAIPADVPAGARHVLICDRRAPEELRLFFLTKQGEICHTHGNFTSGRWACE